METREWPWRLRPWVYERGLVWRGWYYRLALRNALSRRVRVGFGPVTTGEDTLDVRKWHIDPIVDAVNRSSARYVANVFFPDEDLGRFDIVVVVKEFESVTPDVVRRLRERGRLLVYDTADVRFVQTASGRLDIYQDPEAFERHYKPFVRSVDALILASPVQRRDFADLGIPQVVIPRPVLNRRYRTAYGHGGPLRVVWQGHVENLGPMERLLAILRQVRADTGLDVRLWFDTDGPTPVQDHVESTEWKIRQWDHVLAAGDVGVTVKPPDDPFQQRKASTKVVSYMAAGLPVVCTPTEADRLVITHGRTGFFAHEDHEWRACLGALVRDPGLRERVGVAARQHVTDGYSVERVTADYVRLFDRLLASPGRLPRAEAAGGR